VAFRAAVETETVKRDLKGAIEQYKKIADGADRGLAAKALLRMAECYERLGQTEARAVYERIVRQFSDQKEAAMTASSRLGGPASAARATGDRAVWTGPGVDLFGRVSPDGTLITYVDWAGTGNLMVRQLTTNTSRPLTANTPDSGQGQHAEYSVVSRDSKQVAYVWFNESGGYDIRVLPLQGSTASPRILFPGSADIRFIELQDWSPDGKLIAVAVSRVDGTGQIAVLSIADGSLHTLKSIDWNVPERMFFSNDSRRIAYSLAESDATDHGDVFVIDVDGAREHPVVIHPADDRVVGWSPDGGRLLFSSDRTGSAGLWAIVLQDGRPTGVPELLRADIGAGAYSLGLSAGGTLYLYKEVASRDLALAPFDYTAGRVGSTTAFSRGFVGRAGNADWSPDGKYLAYAACGGECSVVRSVETGEARRLSRKTLLYLREPRWSPDGTSLVAAGRDRRGRDGIYLIDVASGTADPIVLGTPLGAAPQWSVDGKKIYFRRDPATLVERDLITGVEREVLRQQPGQFQLSPDGRSIVVASPRSRAGAIAKLLLFATDGNAVRELVTGRPEDGWGRARTIAWTPDSRAVAIARSVGGRLELWGVPIDGTRPRKLDVDFESWTRGAQGAFDQGFSLAHDGRHIAFQTGRNTPEVWAIENLFADRDPRR
jgi:Tol biopolymer transport system component